MSLSARARQFLEIAMADEAAANELADALDAALSATVGGNNTFTGNNTHTGNETFNTGTVALDNGATIGDGKDIATATGTGTSLGHTTAQKVSMHGVAPTIQRANANQAAVTATVSGAVATTAATNSTPFGYAQAQADAIVANVNALRVDLLAMNTLLTELRAAMVAKGVIKGAA